MATWQITDGVNGYVTGSSANTTSDSQGEVTGGLTALVSAAAGFVPQIGIEFRTFQVNYNQDIPTYFNGFVNTGAWTYATASAYTAGTKAIVVYYTDSQGLHYSSIGAQSGSSVNVISVTQVPAQLYGNENVQITLTFNCILYPVSGTGSTITLTNGKASVLLEDLLY